MFIHEYEQKLYNMLLYRCEQLDIYYPSSLTDNQVHGLMATELLIDLTCVRQLTLDSPYKRHDQKTVGLLANILVNTTKLLQRLWPADSAESWQNALHDVLSTSRESCYDDPKNLLYRVEHAAMRIWQHLGEVRHSVQPEDVINLAEAIFDLLRHLVAHAYVEQHDNELTVTHKIDWLS